MKPFPSFMLRASIVLLALLLFASPVYAATITVNSTADTTANDGTCTLREAIVAANTDAPSGALSGECVSGAGTDIVDIPSGTYTVASTLNITQPLTVQGAAGTTVQSSANSPVFIVSASNVTLDGMTITHTVAGANGDGIRVSSAGATDNLTFSNLVVTANPGRGIVITDGSPSVNVLNITNTTVSNNTQTGLLISRSNAGVIVRDNFTLSGSTFSGNAPTGASATGDIIWFNFNGSAQVQNTSITSAGARIAMQVRGRINEPGPQVDFTNVNVTGNVTTFGLELQSDGNTDFSSPALYTFDNVLVDLTVGGTLPVFISGSADLTGVGAGATILGDGTDTGVTVNGGTAEISGFNVLNHAIGIGAIDNPAEGLPSPTVTASFNRILDNTVGAQAGAGGVVTGTLDANNNWWGCNEGPASPPDCDDAAAAGGTLTPITEWLVLDAAAAAAVCQQNDDATVAITADLLQTNGATGVTTFLPDGAAPNNVPLTFGTDLGTITSPVDLADNVVASTLTVGPGSQPGTANVTAQLDNETVALNGLAIPQCIIPTSTPIPGGGGNGGGSDIEINDPVISKSGSPTSLLAGEVVVWTITVRNPGGTNIDGIVVSDTVPSTVSVTGATSTRGTVTVSGQSVTVNIGTLASGESATITISAVAGADAPPGSVCNMATVGDRSATGCVTILPPQLPPTGGRPVEENPLGIGLVALAAVALLGAGALILRRRMA